MLQSIPIGHQFLLMQFSPSLNQAPLTFRQCARNKLHGIDTENAHFFLVVGVEVRHVVLRADLGKHSDNYAEEATQFRHERILYFGTAHDHFCVRPTILALSRERRGSQALCAGELMMPSVSAGSRKSCG